LLLTVVGAEMHASSQMQSSSQRRGIREWWRAQPSSFRAWNLFAAGAALILFSIALAQSGTEFRALRWHMKNGNRVVVHGLSFPVSSWYVPKVRKDYLDISDKSGPLRPGEDGYVFIRVSWIKDDPYDGLDRLSNLNALQRARQQSASLDRSGYHNVQVFSHRYLDQDFNCVRELDPRFHAHGDHGGSFSCYGDGPIYLIFFAGSEKAEDQFEKMLANVTRVGSTSR
jgi:hypothetical protein